MKIGSLAPWYGSKRTLAPRIVEQLGEHRVYWEPFCGSCSVLFAKQRCTYETVNDLHKDLINLALVVQNEATAKDLYARVSRTLFHESMLPQAKGILQGDWRTAAGDDSAADVGRAYWYLIFSWMGLNGISGTPLHHTGTFAVRYSGNGGNGATRWASVCESIPDWHLRLVGVQILCRDAFGLLVRLDDAAGTVIYIDGPYFTKGAKYVHDADDNHPDIRRILGIPEGKPLPPFAWHRALATLLRRFRACRIVVSYYAHPLLAELYPDWNVIDSTKLRIAKSMVNSGKRDQSGRTEAPEVLLVNGPVYGGVEPVEASLFA